MKPKKFRRWEFFLIPLTFLATWLADLAINNWLNTDLFLTEKTLKILPAIPQLMVIAGVVMVVLYIYFPKKYEYFDRDGKNAETWKNTPYKSWYLLALFCSLLIAAALLVSGN